MEVEASLVVVMACSSFDGHGMLMAPASTKTVAVFVVVEIMEQRRSSCARDFIFLLYLVQNY